MASPNKYAKPPPRPPTKKLNNLDDLEKVKYEKVSYRQKGRTNQGHLIKGNVSNSYKNSGNPSVPSKYETQLFDINRESNAFGSRSTRFDALVSEDPGPGTYANTDTLSLMGRTKQSHSKKGYGNGFISRVDRFPTDVDYKGYFLPGPGAYSSSLPSTRDETESQASMKKQKVMTKTTNGTSSFKALGRIDQRRKNIVPGPGHYHAEKRMIRSQSQASPTSAFRSGVDKLNSLKTRIHNPPVGHYEVNNDFVYTKAESTFNILKNTSNFRVPLNCKRVKVDLYDPFKQIEEDKLKLPGPGAYDNPNTIADLVKRKNSKANRYLVTKKINPGEQNLAFLTKSVIENQNPSISKSAVDIGSRKLSNVTPGPGTYIEPLERNNYEVAAVSNSMFKSDSLRDIYDLSRHRGPGPAFYKIKNAQPKKSFNFNPKRKWL